MLLRVVDEYWMDHIDAMQDLRQGIRLRAYAQTNPVDAYKKESLEMFDEMIDAMKEETVRRLYSIRLRQNEEVKRERVASGMTENVGGDGTVKKRPTKVVKVGRNDLCPCGSRLKWKKCTCKGTTPDFGLCFSLYAAYGRWRQPNQRFGLKCLRQRAEMEEVHLQGVPLLSNFKRHPLLLGCRLSGLRPAAAHDVRVKVAHAHV